MPDHRVHKSIAERLDLAFPKGPPPRLWPARRWAMVACGVAPLVWLLAMFAAGRSSIYMARPLASVHHSLENDCQRCHTQSFTGLPRLVSLAPPNPSVLDSACQTCHPQTSTDHHPNLPSQHLSCAACHREHTGRPKLDQVADRQCSACHGDLRSTDTASSSLLPSLNFVANIDSLASHPQFALLRQITGPEENFPAHGAKDDPNGLWALAAPADRDGQRAWQDKTPLRFNHSKHLAPQGVLKSVDPRTGEKQFQVLSCGDCHQSDSAGRGHLPIRYSTHCATCHALDFSESLHAAGPLPHVQSNLLEAVVRDRLARWITEHPDLVAPGRSPPAPDPREPPPRLPNKTSPAAPPSFADQQAYIQGQMSRTSPSVLRQVVRGCEYCHTVVPPGALAARGPDWQVVPPLAPSRFFPHGKFSHVRHERVACQECHAAALSQSTADLLLPSIDVCRKCHKASSAGIAALSAAAPPGAAASADCVLCHDYHHTQPAQGKTLRELLP